MSVLKASACLIHLPYRHASPVTPPPPSSLSFSLSISRYISVDLPLSRLLMLMPGALNSFLLLRFFPALCLISSVSSFSVHPPPFLWALSYRFSRSVCDRRAWISAFFISLSFPSITFVCALPLSISSHILLALIQYDIRSITPSFSAPTFFSPPRFFLHRWVTSMSRFPSFVALSPSLCLSLFFGAKREKSFSVSGSS